MLNLVGLSIDPGPLLAFNGPPTERGTFSTNWWASKLPGRCQREQRSALSADRSDRFSSWSTAVDPEGLPSPDLEGNETYDHNSIRQYVGDGLPDLIWHEQHIPLWKLGFECSRHLQHRRQNLRLIRQRQLGVVTGWNMRDENSTVETAGRHRHIPALTLDETTYSLSGFPWWNTSLFISCVLPATLDLGYNVPLGKDSGLQNCRIAVNATNVFTITNFPDWIRRWFDFNAPGPQHGPDVAYDAASERAFTLSITTNF